MEKSSIPEEEETKSQGHHAENGAAVMEEATRFPAGVGNEFASCFPSLTEEMLQQVGSKEEMEKNASKRRVGLKLFRPPISKKIGIPISYPNYIEKFSENHECKLYESAPFLCIRQQLGNILYSI